MSRLVYFSYSAIPIDRLPSGASLSDTIIFNGFDTGIPKYYQLGATAPTNPPAWFPDYLEVNITQMTFARPSIYGTPQNFQTIQTPNMGPQTVQIWDVRSVPDNFTLPSPPDLTIHINGLLLESDAKTIDFDFTINNAGTQAASATRVGIYLSDDPIIDKNDVLLTYNDFGSLSGQHKNHIFSDATHKLTLGSPIPGGTHYIGMIVDDNNSVAETNEGNNVSNAIKIVSKTPAPDLTVGKLAVSPTTVSHNGALDLKFTVSNVGNAEGGTALVGVYLSKDSKIDQNDTLWFVNRLGPYPAHWSADAPIDDFPLPGLPAGKYYVGAIIDIFDDVTESNENNNTSNAVAITITNKAPAIVEDTMLLSGPSLTQNILDNDSDPDGDSLKLTGIATNPAKGTVTFDDNGDVTYTSDSGISPADVGLDGKIYDKFVMFVEDGFGGVVKETVNVVYARHGDFDVNLPTLTDPGCPDPVNTDIDVANRPVVPVHQPFMWPKVGPVLHLKGNLQLNETVVYHLAVPDEAYTLYMEYSGKVDGTQPGLFNVPAASFPSIRVPLVPGNIEPDLANQKLATIDLGTPGPNVYTQWYADPLMPGDYTINLTNLQVPAPTNPNALLAYDIYAIAMPDCAGNTPYWARDLGVIKDETTTSYSEYLSRGDRTDYYKFTIEEDSQVAITLVTKNKLSPIRLVPVDPPEFNTGGLGIPLGYTHYASGTTFDTRTSGNANPLPAGTYYFYLQDDAGLPDSKTSYKSPATMEEFLEPYNVYVTTWADGSNNSASFANDLGAIEGVAPVVIDDSISIADPDDWYKFEVGNPAAVEITVQNYDPKFKIGLEFARFNPIDLSIFPAHNNYFRFVSQQSNGLIHLGPEVQLDANTTYWVRVFAVSTYPLLNTFSYSAPFAYPDTGGADYTLTIDTVPIPPGAPDNTGHPGAFLLLGNTGPNILVGNSGASVVRGMGGGDTIDAGGGDDTIEGGKGNNSYGGGTGFNTLDYSGSPTAVSVDLAAGKAKNGYSGNDTLSDIQAVIAPKFNDSLTGDGSANSLAGGGGNDTIEGGAGGDTLDGGAGINTLSYLHSTGGVTVDLATMAASGGDAAGDTISNFRNITGGAGGDKLTGDGNANILNGGLGDDLISGGGGNDILDGGTSTAALPGGNDTVDYSYLGAGSGITVTLGALKVATASVAQTVTKGIIGDVDKIANFENVTGGAGNDVLTGNVGVNKLSGGGGNDTLVGGAGADVLTGGAGDDLFRYGGPADGLDHIADFNTSGADKISIVKAGFGLAAATAANFTSSQYFVSEAGHAATVGHAQLLFDTGAHELWFDGDGTGVKAAVMIAHFDNGATLFATDFELK